MAFSPQPNRLLQQQAADLQATQNLLRAALDSSMDMIQVFKAVRDEQGDIVDFVWILNNQAFEKIYGDVIGKRLLELQPGVVKEGIFETFKQVVETGLPQQTEKQYAHGQLVGWFHQSVVKLNDGVATTTSNITDRKKAEQELLQSKTLLQNIIDAPAIGIAVYKAVRNTDGEVIDFVHEYINRASLTMLDGEDFTGKLFTVHGENAWSQMPQLIEVIQTGTANGYIRESNFRGRRTWFAITNTPLDRDRLVHTWEDITERKSTETEILRLNDQVAQKAADKYQTLFNSINEGFCLLEVRYDSNGALDDLVFQEQNPAFSKYTGLGNIRGEYLKKTLPQYYSYLIDTFEQVVQSGQPVMVENYAQEVDRWYKVQFLQVGNTASHLVAIVFEDITERKRQEMNLAFLAEVSQDLVGLTDIDETIASLGAKIGNHFGLSRCLFVEIDDVQEVCWVSYGWGREGAVAIPGRHRIVDFISPEFQLASRAGETVVIDDVFADPRTEGEQYAAFQILAMVTVPLLRGDEWYFLLGFYDTKPRHWREDELELMRELTMRIWTRVERARAEAALRLSEEEYRQLSAHLEEKIQERTRQLEESVDDLKRSNDSLQQFAYVASHDLQEPLRKIQQFGDLLKTNTGARGEEWAYLDRMQSAARRMSGLIKDLLDYSRIATQCDTLVAVALNQVIEGVLADLELLRTEAQAQIEVDTLPVVEGNALQLGQLFQNLLSNALKFRHPQLASHIQITYERLVADVLPPTVKPTRLVAAYHQIQMIDNGIGFDEQYSDRIFQVFQRLHGKGEYAGTGIGLAICEKVVANHGGAIMARSQPGQGATFTIYLPA